jgi:hypothetical protein
MSDGQQLATGTAKGTPYSPRFQQAEGPSARTLTPPPHNRTGDRGARHRPRTTSEEPAEAQCPHIKAKTPLTRGYACPRWDSNRIPALATAGNSRKHKQSEPVRPMYDPIRRQKCGQCPHFLLPHSEHADQRPPSPTSGRSSSIHARSPPERISSDQAVLDAAVRSKYVELEFPHAVLPLHLQRLSGGNMTRCRFSQTIGRWQQRGSGRPAKRRPIPKTVSGAIHLI